MTILEMLRFYRKFKPLLEKPWVKKALGFFSWLFKGVAKKADTKPKLPPNHPDRKVTPEDIYRGDHHG